MDTSVLFPKGLELFKEKSRHAAEFYLEIVLSPNNYTSEQLVEAYRILGHISAWIPSPEQIEAALKYYELSACNADIANNKLQLFLAYYYISEIYFENEHAKNWKKLTFYLQECYRIMEEDKIPIDEEKWKVYSMLGGIHGEIVNDKIVSTEFVDLAVFYYNRMLESPKDEIKDLANSKLGELYYYMDGVSRYPAAKFYFEQVKHEKFRSSAEMFLAYIGAELGNYSTAKHYFKIIINGTDNNFKKEAYFMLGRLYYGKLEKLIKNVNYKKALKYFEETIKYESFTKNDTNREIAALWSIGNIYHSGTGVDKNRELAISYYKKCLVVLSNVNSADYDVKLYSVNHLRDHIFESCEKIVNKASTRTEGIITEITELCEYIIASSAYNSKDDYKPYAYYILGLIACIENTEQNLNKGRSLFKKGGKLAISHHCELLACFGYAWTHYMGYSMDGFDDSESIKYYIKAITGWSSFTSTNTTIKSKIMFATDKVREMEKRSHRGIKRERDEVDEVDEVDEDNKKQKTRSNISNTETNSDTI